MISSKTKNESSPTSTTVGGRDRCNNAGGAAQQPQGDGVPCPIRLPGSDFGPLSREETLQFMLQRYACAVSLVTHEDASLFAKLKSMFEIETVLLGVLFTVTPILVAAKLASSIPALVIAISCAAFFVSFGYGRSIHEGLKCLAAHKFKILAIEAELGQPPICTLQPKRWILRHGPVVFAGLSIVGLALGLLMLGVPAAMP